MLYDLYAQNVISCDFIQKTEILQCQTCTCQLSETTVSVIRWLLYRHICSSEVFGDFDKEGVLPSSCTGGFWIFSENVQYSGGCYNLWLWVPPSLNRYSSPHVACSTVHYNRIECGRREGRQSADYLSNSSLVG